MRVVPNAIGIGCRRCASSFLHECLNQHPEIAKPPRGLHYFSDNYHRGRDWYLKQLPEKTDAVTSLEFSVSYTYPEHSEKAAWRIYQDNPHTKIFLSVRNPVDRAYSDYLRSLRLMEIANDLTFEDAVEKYPVFLQRSRYSELLAPYMAYFPADQVKILFMEDLSKSLNFFMRPLLEFLGVSETVCPITSGPPGEAGRQTASVTMQRLITAAKNGSDAAAKFLRSESAWRAFKYRHMAFYKRLRAANTREANMAAATRKHLESFFDEDVRWLSTVAGRDLQVWK